MYTAYSNLVLNKDYPQKDGWFCLFLEDDLLKYYNYWFSLGGNKINRCLNGCHITFIAGEKENRLIKKEDLSIFDNVQIEYQYSNVLYTNGESFWLNCYSIHLDLIRQYLGLSCRCSYHITIGNLKRN